MIISRTPFRISFFGGGTDYPGWYKQHGGAVLSTTFDKYCYITCRTLPPFFDHKHRISYSKVEHVSALDEIEHPAVRAILKECATEQGFEIHCDANLPARSGLGSSSTFIVGLLNAVQALGGRRVSKEWLFAEAIRIEQEVLAENVGAQDQAAAAFGGMNVFRFSREGNLSVEPVQLSEERKLELNRHLMLFFTGFSRSASIVAKSQIDNIGRNAGELAQMQKMVDDALSILRSGADLRNLGTLLHETWTRKRRLSDKVSTDQIDQIYDRALRAGAIGGKLLGAGGGGFMLIFAEPIKQPDILAALPDLIHVPFGFETSGSQIIYYAQ